MWIEAENGKGGLDERDEAEDGVDKIDVGGGDVVGGCEPLLCGLCRVFEGECSSAACPDAEEVDVGVELVSDGGEEAAVWDGHDGVV